MRHKVAFFYFLIQFYLFYSFFLLFVGFLFCLLWVFTLRMYLDKDFFVSMMKPIQKVSLNHQLKCGQFRSEL